jgi:hypothetical protein
MGVWLDEIEKATTAIEVTLPTGLAISFRKGYANEVEP